MSSDRRRGLGKGLGALIPAAPAPDRERPSDVFFPRSAPEPGEPSAAPGAETVSQPPTPEVQTDGFTGNGPHGGVADPDGPGPVPGAAFAEVPVDQIRANPRQPRQVFDEDDLAELVTSITELGVLQPIVVRPVAAGAAGSDDAARYELVMGERRLRASMIAGKATVPAIIRSTDDEHMLRDALLENLHRAQLNPLEEAAAYEQLLQDFGCTHEDLAARIGRSRPQISNTIRLLKLPPLVQRRVASGVLSAGHARALLGLPDGAAMERLAQRIVAEGLSVRSVEEIVVLGGDQGGAQRRPRTRTEQPERLERVAQDLSERLETRVKVVMGTRKGKITVDFAGEEDLERILDALGRGEGT